MCLVISALFYKNRISKKFIRNKHMYERKITGFKNTILFSNFGSAIKSFYIKCASIVHFKPNLNINSLRMNKFPYESI